MTLNQISEKLLLAVKMKQSTDEWTIQLSSIHYPDLIEELKNDNKKKAFWINCYNAYYQILRNNTLVAKSEIYKGKKIEIAGGFYSLDDIEHGILRKYRYKFSLGYLPNIFAPRNIKNLAVDKIDYRIHFALNCGAASCPPIAFYSAKKINAQLDMSTLSFLEGETDIKEEEKEIHITKLFQWFRGDFGGTKGIRRILSKTLKIDTKAYKLVYKPYSWEDDLGNFV
jgi:hypothetical protein